MKKVININFQGRVVPIEETAYELLKQYIESLRKYFAFEEGRDEIINDIEGRIAELFSERLKNGANCITDADVNTVIAGMGRPEDFDPQEPEAATAGARDAGAHTTSTSWTTGNVPGRGSLYRNADDKIVGGVCSGLANYLRIDPVIMRILFVVFFGVLFWVYILLWIIVPSKSVSSSITKRLYRNPDQKVLGGVCGGLAAYFNMEVWIPRLIFALPFIFAIISSGFSPFWDWDFGFVPNIVSGSFGGSMFMIYIVLWIAVPVANTAAEKLEMRGQKVDLDSIRQAINKDLQNVKARTEKWGTELKETAENLGQRASEQAKVFTAQAGPAVRRSSNGLGHAIGVIIKAFLIFIFAIVAITLFGVLIGLLFGGIALAPLKDFVLEGSFQNSLVWLTLFLFLGTPLIALITWGVRRIMGVRSKRHFLGFAFAALWIAGLICASMLFYKVAGNYRRVASLDEEPISITQPDSILNVTTSSPDWKKYDRLRWMGFGDDDDWGFDNINQDSIMLSTVRISMVKSNDSDYHVYRVRSSRGRNIEEATNTASTINFDVTQNDSTITLPKGFFITKKSKFRNQRVWMVMEIPVGKKISFSRNISGYNWFTVNYDRHRFNIDDFDDDDDYYNDDFDDERETSSLYRPIPGRTYLMKEDGRPERVND